MNVRPKSRVIKSLHANVLGLNFILELSRILKGEQTDFTQILEAIDQEYSEKEYSAFIIMQSSFSITNIGGLEKEKI
ncbi:CLUMA_CG014787, isoform A [Clunio marinus]|uniref:CLUMA_CG014787, isoform A n=1 Tax=Clunio marinus TaxID=568069 RepID=A0A1J1IPJ6_9DIPT|nr:CLUMA_CG014787, isoform A [Clunio marinus]